MPCLRGRSLPAEPRSGGDLAQLLMEKAAGDEKILFRLIDDDDIVYERTHNIAYLLKLLDKRRNRQTR